MSKNPYWNTIWCERDQEFYWSGTKFGLILGTGATLLALTALWMGYDTYKDSKED